MQMPTSRHKKTVFESLEEWNRERMLSFDRHNMEPYLAPAGDDIEVEVVSLVTGKPKTLAKLSGLATYSEVFGGFDEEIKGRNVTGHHVMLAALDTSSRKDVVEMAVPWIFYEQKSDAGSPLAWKSTGYSTLRWAAKKSEEEAGSEYEERSNWQIVDYRVNLMANSKDNVTGGLDYDT